MPKPTTAKPLDKPATERQIHALLCALSVAGDIDSHWVGGEREYDTDAAVEWVRCNFGFPITDLDQLTHSQIGLCFRELDG